MRDHYGDVFDDDRNRFAVEKLGFKYLDEEKTVAYRVKDDDDKNCSECKHSIYAHSARLLTLF